ncbi:MAG TPA: multiheme c-type cytochrome [Terriglobales bacterium]|nr:multiheme c-type cytochrome [Terriglobales bacterium]
MAEPSYESSPVRHAFLSEKSILRFGVAGGGLLCVVLSGCAIAILPFSVFAQLAIVLHTAAGLAAVPIFALWQLSHWLGARKVARTSKKISAYIGFWLLATSVVTGLVVGWQAAFGRFIGSVWDSLHLWSGILALPFLAYHLWPSSTSDDRPSYVLVRRRMWIQAGIPTLALFAFCGLLATHFSREQRRQFWGQHIGTSDFQPSMVETETGRPIPVEVLANSDSCGTSDCHAAIYQEWRSSAHRWSAEDEFFQEVRAVTTGVKGIRETEKCGACHDPVSMLSGHKDPLLGRSAPGYREGDSCVVCHAIRKVDERGIGSYVLGAPEPYLYESAASGFGRWVNHFLLRAYPDQHNQDYDLTLVRRPESCAACHKEFDVLDEREGPVQVETQYDDWKRGKWNTDPDPSRRQYCQQCHMYLVTTAVHEADPYDLKTRLGRRHRNHAFAAGNQYMPAAIGVHDSGAHIRNVEQWLRGEREVPEIANTWPRGPIVELQIEAPQACRATSELAFKVRLTNRKVGHGFPTGPLNIARAWIEVVVGDASGHAIFHSGLLDDANHIEAGSYILKPLAINSAGQMVMKPDLWHPLGPKFRPAILAQQSASYDFAFHVPVTVRGPLGVRARFRYAKANQFFMDVVYSGKHRRPPVTDLASAQTSIEVTR